jgi:hypothetical protein
MHKITPKIATHYQYDHPSQELEWFIQRMHDLQYKYYASDLLCSIRHSPEFNMEASVRRAIAVMRLTGIPVQEHFTPVYRSEPFGIRRDWRLSEMASGLVILVCESREREIQKVQQALLRYLGI